MSKFIVTILYIYILFMGSYLLVAFKYRLIGDDQLRRMSNTILFQQGQSITYILELNTISFHMAG